MVHQTFRLQFHIICIHSGEDVVFVCNDWHTGPLSSYLKSNYQSNGIYRNAKVFFFFFYFLPSLI